MKEEEKVFSPKLRKTVLVLVIVILVLLLFWLLANIGVFSAIGMILSSLQAVLFGIFFACIQSPIMRGFEHLLGKKLATPEKPRQGMIRGLSVTFSMLIMITVIVLVLLLVIPQLVITLEKILPALGTMIDDFNNWFQGISSAAFWQERVVPMVQEFTDNIGNIILSHFGVGTEFYASLSTGLMTTLGMLLNVFIGFILSIYLLVDQDRIIGVIRKLSTALFKKKWGGYCSEAIEEGIRIFSGFFGARMIEVGIIGLLNFIGMMILQLPYATLISVMVAFANIIPFFGAYIGCALGAAIIILVNPWQALVFIIFQIVLLQIDGNLIGPKLLGHSIGLSALWVIAAVLLFTGCFGMWGAFIGVPLFAWIYYLIKRLAEQLLEKQGMPVETEAYMDKKAIPDGSGQQEIENAEEEEAGITGSRKRGKKRSRKKRKNG